MLNMDTPQNIYFLASGKKKKEFQFPVGTSLNRFHAKLKYHQCNKSFKMFGA